MPDLPPHRNLIAGPPPTLLPDDPAGARLDQTGTEEITAVTAAHPSSSLCWAMLAERALSRGTAEDDLAAYAYARTGYHRGLDVLRRSGWKGSGPIPWEHRPNQGFLRALWALSVAAGRIGEADEQQRCAQFLRDSTETGYAALAAADASGASRNA